MHKDKIIITGINGFVGAHLARQLNNTGISVIGIGMEPIINQEIDNIVTEYYQANLVNKWPDIPNIKAIIHLAGLASVALSFNQPQSYIGSNTAILTNMCEYYLKQNKKPRIIVVSSGNIYNPKQLMPINETGEIELLSPYAVSKICNENQVKYYRNRGLDCIIARPFNHIGPGQADGFLLPDLYKKIISLPSNKTVIKTGNINTKRDYTDVRDIVKAYEKLAMADKLNHNLYNICSGISVSGIDMFNELKDLMSINNISYKIDQSLIRPTDAENIVGDSTLLRDELKWTPEISLKQTISDYIKSKS